MEKKCVTKDAVAAAMMALSSRGEKTTILAIRQELGNTGSMSTICKHMSEIAKEGGVKTPKIDLAVPEVFQQTFETPMTAPWEIATGIASEDTDVIRKSSARRVNMLEQQLMDSMESLFMLEHDFADCQSALTRAKSANSTLREENITLKAECSQLEKRCQDTTARLDAYANRFDAALEKLDGLHIDQESTDASKVRR